MRDRLILTTLILILIAGTAYAAGGGQPQPTSVHGVTILIDFDDAVATYTPTDLNDFMNLSGYTGHNNNGSVRDYFLDVSDGLFDYTNAVTTEYFRAPQLQDYYASGDFDDVRLLVTQALQWFEQQGFDFTNFDSDGDGVIDAINVLYAGSRDQGGLRAHAEDDLTITLDGYQAVRYQVTGLRASRPPLATVAHENGHMLFGWPDLYPLSGSSTGDLGAYCLMGDVYGDFTDPVEPNAFLKWKAGWIVPIELDGLTANGFLRDDINQAGIIRHPDYPQNQECYVLENRQATGRDSRLPDSGIAIYHLDDGTDVDSEIYLVEADGATNVRDNVNAGDAGDLFRSPHYTRFDFGSFPALTWSDGTVADLHMENISTVGPLMTYTYGFYDYAVIEISSFPPGLEAGWVLGCSNGYEFDSNGVVKMEVPAGFNYQVTYDDYPYWATPAPILKFVSTGLGYPYIFRSAYTGSFLPISGSDLVDTQEATGVAIVDIDADGDDDMFVANESGQNRLLRNDGYFFVDIAPANLANAGSTQSAAWADVDNDGDLDVFLVDSGGSHVLFEQTNASPLTFVDVTSQTPFGSVGAVGAASWSDVDQDGALDLFLARSSDLNLLYMGSLTSPLTFTVGNVGFASRPEVGASSGRWGDFDADGFSDLYVSADNGPRIVRNSSGTLAHPGVSWFQAEHSVDSHWGDLNNDGLLDLISLQSNGIITIRLQNAEGRFEVDSFHTFNNLSISDAVAIELGDFNNDGWLDIFCDGSGTQDLIGMNTGYVDPANNMLMFDLVPLGYDLHAGPGQAVGALDFNNDGGLDLFVGKGGTTDIMILNFDMTRGHWLQVDLTGTSANAGAVGAKVYVTAGGMTQVREVAAGGGPGQGSRILHFGLGTATSADLVRVVWDGSGSESYLGSVAADQKLAISQGTAARSFPQVEAAQDTPSYATAFGGVFPNPFNPKTSISFTLGTETDVRAAIYDLRGRRVTELVNQKMSAGPHELEWSGEDAAGRSVASGTYLFRMTAGAREFRSKLVLVK